MLKQKSLLYRFAAIFVDLFVCGVALFLVYLFYLAAHDPTGEVVSTREFRIIFTVFVIICLAVTLFFLFVTRVYESLRLKSAFELFFAMIQAAAMSMVFLTAIVTFIGSPAAGILTEQQRKHIALHYMVLAYSIICFVFLLSEKLLIKFWLGHLRRQARNIRRILIVGTGERAQRLENVVGFHKHWGLHVVGFVKLGEQARLPAGGKAKNAAEETLLPAERIVGDIEDIADIMDRYIVDEVVFAISLGEAGYLEKAIEKCEEVGITFHLIADFLDTAISKVELDKIGNIPLLTFSSAPQNIAATFAKRIFDLAISSAVLLAGSIVLIPVAILVKLTSKGPVFFRQKRVGLNGRVFTLYKFRSMVTGAEKMQEQLKDRNVMTGPVFKIKEDPRITRLGRFMRKWSIDELPQLLNVFTGHMSIVGPRPLPTYEVERFERWQRRRLSMKPGLTCLWQTGGRSKITDFDDWMKLDLQYIDNWSFGLDVKILLKTVPAVLFSKGAH